MIDQFQIGPLRNFVYLVTFGGESLVVDPQPELAPWERRLAELGARLCGVLLTHTHHDHVGGVPEICEKYGVPVYVHALDEGRLTGKAGLGLPRREVEASGDRIASRLHRIVDGDRIAVGNCFVEVLHTPGHSGGECSYLVQESAKGPSGLFSGDTVFVGDVGRTDLETGSNEEMFATIQRLKTLPPDTVIYPGHDYGRTPTSTIARESAQSAAWRCKSVEELAALP
ncbi:MAG: MBL fold metallo-hydrolase [Deltaproteobacteria bacterium]|nr:MBL fold metallo-hydrolase [Deltaproteobacteria bacterium]